MRVWYPYELARFRATLDIGDQFLLLLFQLGALAVELPLRLCEGTLVLPQPFGGGHCPPEESLLQKRLI